MVTLSTAESELLEVVEGFALGEATAVLVEEMVSDMIRTAYTDSQAAQAVMLNEGGSWRIDTASSDACCICSPTHPEGHMVFEPCSRRTYDCRPWNQTVVFSENEEAQG